MKSAGRKKIAEICRVSGGSFRDLTGYIDSGIPVIVWGKCRYEGTRIRAVDK